MMVILLNINMEFVNGILFVRPIGTLNINTSNKLKNTLIPTIKNYGIKNLVYNFLELRSIDETGKSTLLDIYNEILCNNGKVLVVNNNFKLLYFKETNNELSALKILQI